MGKWKPIDTAPSLKNVLIFYKNRLGKGRIIKAFKCGKYEHEDTNGVESEFSDYSEEKDAYFTPPGWYEVIDNWDVYSHIFVSEGEPTLWQDLPKPPK